MPTYQRSFSTNNQIYFLRAFFSFFDSFQLSNFCLFLFQTLCQLKQSLKERVRFIDDMDSILIKNPMGLDSVKFYFAVSPSIINHINFITTGLLIVRLGLSSFNAISSDFKHATSRPPFNMNRSWCFVLNIQSLFHLFDFLKINKSDTFIIIVGWDQKSAFVYSKKTQQSLQWTFYLA